MTPEEITESALGIKWKATESAARRVAEWASDYCHQGEHIKTMYAIRQKSTGYYIPISQLNNPRGATSVEPVSKDSGSNIRLFTRLEDAKRSLTYWLKGKIRYSIDYNDEWEELESWVVEPANKRKSNHMEIVEVKIIQTRVVNEKD